MGILCTKGTRATKLPTEALLKTPILLQTEFALLVIEIRIWSTIYFLYVFQLLTPEVIL